MADSDMTQNATVQYCREDLDAKPCAQTIFIGYLVDFLKIKEEDNNGCAFFKSRVHAIVDAY